MIEIRKAASDTLKLLYTVEDRRLDSEEVLVRAKGGAFTLDYKPLPGALWRMGGAQSDSGIAPERWLEDSDRDAYLAWLDGQLAGQMLVEAWEYGLARVRDVRVALSLRRRGVGESLLGAGGRMGPRQAFRRPVRRNAGRKRRRVPVPQRVRLCAGRRRYAPLCRPRPGCAAGRRPAPCALTFYRFFK